MISSLLCDRFELIDRNKFVMDLIDRLLDRTDIKFVIDLN